MTGSSGYRRLRRRYGEAASRSRSESERAHWVDRDRQLRAWAERVDAGGPDLSGTSDEVRRLLEFEHRQVSQEIALQIARDLH
ncbi:hypothetical protein GIS00_22055 [Nakamurella sp. YIM 132087]|uniref:Uncharacterized protein n=1 Tax=Nakamurella alba TaxID=2665158 RepID=A0A7K1FTW9_9ACTN|nr:hypothetical protein [Nakamurella alba]MTD16623.1 hypothetical protein [Nakamurella alba]